MKTIFITLTLILALAGIVTAGEYVSPYFRSDGTLVQGHYRSRADSSHNNNYSTQGNSNPYTGERGTQAPTWNDRSPDYNQRTSGYPGTLNAPTNYRNIYR
jgi:hypothetical protein